jgi:hypothetical protein
MAKEAPLYVKRFAFKTNIVCPATAGVSCNCNGHLLRVLQHLRDYC